MNFYQRLNSGKIKEIYKEMKDKYNHSGFIIGTKSRIFDFIVLGFDRDIYVKIVKPQYREKVHEYIESIKKISKRRRFIKIRYVLVILNERLDIEEERIMEFHKGQEISI